MAKVFQSNHPLDIHTHPFRTHLYNQFTQMGISGNLRNMKYR